MEVIGGLLHTQIGPKGLHNLLAVEAVAWGQSQQLEEAPGLPQAPPTLFDEPRSNTQTKAAEQPDAHHLKLAPLAVSVVVAGTPPCWSCWAAGSRWGRFPILSPYPLLYPLAGWATGSLCAPVTSKVFIQREAQAEEPLPNHQLSMASG